MPAARRDGLTGPLTRAVAGYATVMVLTGAALATGLRAPAPGAPAPDARAAATVPAAAPATTAPAAPAAPVTTAPPVPAGPAGGSEAGAATAGASVAKEGVVVRGQDGTFRPARIVLPGGERALVQPADVSPEGSLVIPENPQVVGYWTGGALPGDPVGSVVLAGHVDSARFGIGVLSVLKKAQVGQVLQVGNGNRVQRYRITDTRTVRQQSLAQEGDLFRRDGPPQLVVITCGGPFNPTIRRYRDNVIVIAEPLA